jgi:hypothetical protein
MRNSLRKARTGGLAEHLRAESVHDVEAILDTFATEAEVIWGDRQRKAGRPYDASMRGWALEVRVSSQGCRLWRSTGTMLEWLSSWSSASGLNTHRSLGGHFGDRQCHRCARPYCVQV